ncbi:hypothetical protein [Candidatus Thiodictyon syntrophicum]|uniref:Lipoprotein n=1 Tax=Candidatus Thiodictyon syntrophicum TaxID=1166950 RepID=A0A2K8UCZ1_9GAMM|nr:hypothetical protein [Candidatus Thiodictyon syntrophicum]AUB83436.1 hypothetical protein THSYN_22455 [Candidatus Thiodictyon syntrophicum]
MKMHASLRLTAFTLALLSGCTGVSPVKPDGSGLPVNLKAEKIAVIAMTGPPLNVMTAGGVGRSSIATATSPAEAIIAVGLTAATDALTRPEGRPSTPPSPSELIASSLRDILGKELSLNLDLVTQLRSGTAAAGKVQAPGRYTLEVATDINLLAYRPLAWATYQYILQAHARILSPTGVILWQNACAVSSLTPDPALQIDRHDFQVNGGQRLKEVMQTAADRCARSLAPTQGRTGV